MANRIAVSNSRVAVDRFEELTKGTEWELIVTHATLAGLQNQ
jgi:hypothetical protein